MTDEGLLVRRAVGGDRAAYGELVERHKDVAFRAAYLITGDPAEADDAAQDAFLRAHAGLARFDTSRPFRPWLMCIVTRTALNRLKSSRRRDSLAERLAAPLRTETSTVEDAAGLSLQQQRLYHALGQLSASDRELITLRYLLEMPEAEVGEILAVRIGTVKSRTHRALERLRDLIRREYPDLHPMASHG